MLKVKTLNIKIRLRKYRQNILHFQKRILLLNILTFNFYVIYNFYNILTFDFCYIEFLCFNL